MTINRTLDYSIVFQRFAKKPENDKGFSLLELATAVGIVLVFTLIGLLSYRGIAGQAEQVAVNKAAEETYNKAYAYLIDGDEKTNPISVQDEYNNSQGDTEDITVQIKILSPSRLKVWAFMGEYEATRITPSSNTDNNSNTDEEGNPIVPPITGGNSDLSNFTYKCDDNEKGYLPMVNIGENTKVYMWEKGKKNQTFKEVKYESPDKAIAEDPDLIRWKTRAELRIARMIDQPNPDYSNIFLSPEMTFHWQNINHTDVQKEFYSYENTIYNISEEIPMKAGVEYQLMYDGDVELFTAPGHKTYQEGGGTGLANCLRSIDNLGASTNLKGIIYIGGEKLINLPTSIPKTVVTLHGAFENASLLNDPNIKQWDVSNVRTTEAMFYNAASFDQDISGWDVSNVRVMMNMFALTQSFNQNLSKWDVSNVIKLGGMFKGTDAAPNAFNNGCRIGVVSCPLTWDTSSAARLESMFGNNRTFNQQLLDESGDGPWDLSSAQDVRYMFVSATRFDQDLSNWVLPKGVSGGTNTADISRNFFDSLSKLQSEPNKWPKPTL